MGFQSYAGVDAEMYRRVRLSFPQLSSSVKSDLFVLMGDESQTADHTAWGGTSSFLKIAELERQWKAVE